MLVDYSLKMPKNIIAGEHAIEQLSGIIATGIKKIVIFTDKGILGAGLADLPKALIEKAGVDYTIISEIPAEPSYHEAQAMVDEFKKEQADFIIAIGGGSVMDVAKLASILATDEYKVKDLLDDPLLAKKQITSLMIPTTAGTGAEATPNSIVGVPEKELKIGIVNPEMIADYVLLDSRMIKNLPKPIAAATGVDALCHAMLLTPVMKFNQPAIKDLLAVAYDRVVKNGDKELTVDQKSGYMLSQLEEIVQVLEIPTSLKEFNVPEEDLDGLVAAGMEVTRLLVNNKREVTPEDARKIYLEIL